MSKKQRNNSILILVFFLVVLALPLLINPLLAIFGWSAIAFAKVTSFFLYGLIFIASVSIPALFLSIVFYNNKKKPLSKKQWTIRLWGAGAMFLLLFLYAFAVTILPLIATSAFIDFLDTTWYIGVYIVLFYLVAVIGTLCTPFIYLCVLETQKTVIQKPHKNDNLPQL